MYSAENYIWGWVAYSTGALCLLFCLWLLVRKIGIAAIRHILLLLALVALFTPVTAYRDDPHLAPAFFVSLYEGLLASGDDLGFQRGLAPILAIGFFTLFFYTLLRIIIWRVKKRRPQSKPQAEATAPEKATAQKKATAKKTPS